MLLVFFGDAHGALVRYMEARRLAGTGIKLETDFVSKTKATKSGPVWLEDTRVALVVSWPPPRPRPHAPRPRPSPRPLAKFRPCTQPRIKRPSCVP